MNNGLTPQSPGFWDLQYAGETFKYGTRPNAFLRSQAHRLRSSSDVLVPGDGEGRNGVWLAEQGHRVTAVDVSTVGLAKARALAAERGVVLQTVQADLAQWQPPQRFDAVVLCYLHLPPAIRPSVHRRLLASLRAGGLLILEAFHPSQLGRGSGGPKQVDMLIDLEALRADFGPGLDEIMAEETEVELDEGMGHHGAARVTRLVARRP